MNTPKGSGLEGLPRALVLGATGHLGQAIVRALIATGYRVSAASRGRAEALGDLGDAVDVLVGDLDRDGVLEAWVRGHHVIVDAAAPYPLNLFVDAGPAAFARARRRTERLVDAARRHDAMLVFLSTFATLSRPWEAPAAAQAARWRREVHPYFAVKSMMECLVLDAASRGLRAVVVNPSSCVGPWDTRPAALSLVGSVLSGTFAITVRDQVVNVLDVRDLAACVRSAMDLGPFGCQLPISGHNIRFDELTARIALAAGINPPKFRVTPTVGTLSSLWIEAGWALVGRPSPMPTIGALLIADSHPMREEAAQRALGVSLRPLDVTIADAVAWRSGTFR